MKIEEETPADRLTRTIKDEIQAEAKPSGKKLVGKKQADSVEEEGETEAGERGKIYKQEGGKQGE